MYPRITNASDNNKPIIGVLDRDTVDKVNQIYDDYDYELTPRKKMKRTLVIMFILFVILLTFYNILCVLEYGEVSASSLTVGKVGITSDNILSVELKSNDYDISKNEYMLYMQGMEDDIMYLTITEPIIVLKKLGKSKDVSFRRFDINIENIEAVYYMGKEDKDSFLIWKR
jgi:hypothetical protein